MLQMHQEKNIIELFLHKKNVNQKKKQRLKMKTKT
jgi:hypothetical protein